MANMKKTFELAFAIGGALSPSFKAANTEAANEIAKLSKKSAEAMKLNKLQKEFDNSLKDITDKASKMGAAWGKVVDSIVGPLKQVAVWGGIAGVAVYGLAYKTAKMGDDAVKGAAKMGVTTQQFSKMAYAATQSGMSVEQFTGNMGRLNKIVSDSVKKGVSEVYVNNKRLMSLRDENKNVKDRTRLLLEASDAFKKLTDENEKFTFATIMFGKSGADMIPLLEQGGEAIRKMMNDADRLGIVFDDLAGQRASAFIDSWGELKAAAQGLSIAVGQQLHEPLTRVNQAISGWIVANRELVAQKVKEFVQDIIKWVKENKEGIIGLKNSIVEAIHQFGKWIEKNGGLVEVLKKVGKAFIAFKALGVVFAIMNAVTATAMFVASMVTLILQTKALLAAFGGFKAVAALLGGLALPVLAIVAAVVSLGIATYQLIKHWDGVVYFFKNLTTTVPIFFNDLVDDIKGLFGGLPEWLQGIMAPIKNIVLGPIQAIQALISGDIRGFFTSLGKTILSYIYTIPLMIVGAGNEIVKAIFGIDVIGAVKAWISPVVDVVWDILDTGINAVAEFFVNEFNTIKDAFGESFLYGIGVILGSIPTLFIRMAAAVIKAIFSMDIVSAGIKWVSGFISAVGGAIKSFFSGEITAVKDAFGRSFLSGIGEIAGRVPSLFIRMGNDVIKAITGIDLIGVATEWVNGFVDTILGVIDRVKGVFAGVVDFIRGFFLGELMGIKDSFSNGFLTGIKDVFIRLYTLIPRLLNDAVKAITGIDLIATGKAWIQKFVDGVLTVLKGAGSAVTNAIKSLIPDSVLNVLGGVTKTVSGAVSAVGGAAKAVTNALPLRKFGDGGIATEPSLVAEDGKPEMVIPLTKPARAAELIRQVAPELPELQVVRESVPALPDNNMAQFAQIKKTAEPYLPASPVVPEPKPTNPPNPTIVPGAKDRGINIDSMKAADKERKRIADSLWMEMNKWRFPPYLNMDMPERKKPEYAKPPISMLNMPELNAPELKMPELKMPNLSKNDTNRNVGGTFNFTPNITITVGGGESSTVKSAVEDALSKAKAEFEKWFTQMQYSNARVATR